MAAAEPDSSPSRIEAEIGRARSLLQKREFSQALGTAEALLAEFPENRDLLYLIAVSQRYLGRIPDALTTLRRFETLPWIPTDEQWCGLLSVAAAEP